MGAPLGKLSNKEGLWSEAAGNRVHRPHLPQLWHQHWSHPGAPKPDPGPLVQTQEVRTSASLYWCISRPWAAPGLLERAHRKQEGQKTQEGSSEVAGGQVVGSLPTDAFLGSVSGGRRDLSSIMKA